MLAISRTTPPETCVVDLVPCQIIHDGPITANKRYWTTKLESDGTKTTYFRGRRLRGRVVKVPEEYRGVVLRATPKTIVELTPTLNEDVEPEFSNPTRVADEVSNFEDLTVWGHDCAPAAEDSFIKGIDEWVAFAEAIHRD